MWNCRRGLVDAENKPSTKMVEVRNFMENEKLHLCCLVEADLHGPTSRYRRRHPLSTKDIENNLGIPGYKVLLPKSWEVHGQARVLLYAKDELQVKIRDLEKQNSDLQNITCEISLGREKKTVVSYFYRDFTGGVSGLRDLAAQVKRWTRQTRLWKNISKGNKDVLCLGDANLCAERWNEENFKDKELAEITHNF